MIDNKRSSVGYITVSYTHLHLKSVNEDLLDRNMVLEQQITNLEKALRGQQLDSMAINSIRQVPQADYQLFKDVYKRQQQGRESGFRREERRG